jgi:hypothetical protein
VIQDDSYYGISKARLYRHGTFTSMPMKLTRTISLDTSAKPFTTLRKLSDGRSHYRHRNDSDRSPTSGFRQHPCSGMPGSIPVCRRTLAQRVLVRSLRAYLRFRRMNAQVALFPRGPPLHIMSLCSKAVPTFPLDRPDAQATAQTLQTKQRKAV